jgi:preprotein translocase subunit SecG
MEILLTILYVIVCVFLILVVLLQSGKAGDLASTFGGVSSQTAFGSRGTANVLSKATTICAAAFLVLALVLAVWSSQTTGSVLEEASEEAAAVPAATETTETEEAAPAPEPADAPATEAPADTPQPAPETE